MGVTTGVTIAVAAVAIETVVGVSISLSVSRPLSVMSKVTIEAMTIGKSKTIAVGRVTIDGGANIAAGITVRVMGYTKTISIGTIVSISIGLSVSFRLGISVSFAEVVRQTLDTLVNIAMASSVM